jgi:pyruvate,water dikinase
LRDRPWLDVVRQWDHELKPQLRSQNRTFQAVDPSSLDDGALADHVARLFAHVERGAELHFWLHGHDLGPIALYLYSCVGWGIDPADAVVALAGASPSTTAPLEQLVAIRAELDSAGSPPSSITEVRAISAAAARLLDDYRAEYGDRLAAGYDVDTPTLRELPGALLTSIVEARPPDVVDVAATVAALRERVPGADRARFDVELGDARAVMNLRDDNGPITFEWPMGLLRRALLDAGRRLADDGRLADSAHVFELTVDEVVTLLERADSSVGGDDGDAVIGFRPPSRDVISARAARRHELRALDPPATLGPAEPTPPLDALPDPLPRLIEMVQFTIEQLDMAGATATDALSGTGIGTDTYRGRVCRAATADEAMDRMAPGDVLVVRATSPAFNMVLSIAGAVVTASGGPLSHAAVLARELGIPAVVGAAGAVDLPDGAFVEVDPVAGRVSVV